MSDDYRLNTFFDAVESVIETISNVIDGLREIVNDGSVEEQKEGQPKEDRDWSQ